MFIVCLKTSGALFTMLVNDKNDNLFYKYLLYFLSLKE